MPVRTVLVSCPRNKHAFRRRSVGCFSRRERRSYLDRYVRSEQRRKTANWPRPEGCDENGSATALLVGYVSVQICALLLPVRLGPPCRRPILIATKDMLISGDRTPIISTFLRRFSISPSPSIHGSVEGRKNGSGMLPVSSSSPVILAVLHGCFSPQPLPSFPPSILPFCKIVQELPRDSRQAWVWI